MSSYYSGAVWVGWWWTVIFMSNPTTVKIVWGWGWIKVWLGGLRHLVTPPCKVNTILGKFLFFFSDENKKFWETSNFHWLLFFFAIVKDTFRLKSLTLKRELSISVTWSQAHYHGNWLSDLFVIRKWVRKIWKKTYFLQFEFMGAWLPVLTQNSYNIYIFF